MDDSKKNITLNRFLVQCQDRCPTVSGELTRVIEQMGVVGKIISGHAIHQRIPLAIGSRYEIDQYEKSYRDFGMKAPPCLYCPVRADR